MTRRQLIIVAHDAATTAAALLLAFLLRWGSAEFAARTEPIGLACAVTLPVALAAYWVAGLHRSPWKFVSLADVNRIGLAAAAPALFLVLLDFVSRGALIVPRTVPAIYWLVQLFLLVAPRVAYRSHRSRRSEKRAFAGTYRAPVVIAGTDDEADGLIRRLRRDPVSALEPVGLLTLKPRQLRERIGGVPVIGMVGDLAGALAALKGRGLEPRRLILTCEALRSPDVDDLLGAARRLGIAPVRLLQNLTDVAEAGTPLQLAPVSIDDLLGRPPRELDLRPVRDLVTGRRVVVTGAGGSIGGELCRQVAELGAAAILLVDHSELALCTITRELAASRPDLPVVQHLGSVCDRTGLRAAVQAFRPALVFHAAALKHVDVVEAHPVAAADTNLLGTAEVADAAADVGALCGVFISTDKAVDPVSVLGATKRAAERVWAAADARARRDGRPTRFVAVRFGNVLGSSGSVIPLFSDQLRRGGPLTVTDPAVERYFMTISEAVRLVLVASALGVSTGEASPAYVLDMGEPIRIADLARRMIRLAGLEPDRDVAITFTGMRPGERLTEILESASETLRSTEIAGIRAVASDGAEAEVGPDALDRLRRLVAAHDADAVRSLLRELVPEYRPAPMTAQPSFRGAEGEPGAHIR